MTPLFKKLNLKTQKTLMILSAPDSFAEETHALHVSDDTLAIHTRAEDVDATDFLLGFGTKLSEVEAFAKVAAEKTAGDAIVWFAYPKGSSKNYKCEFNRDNGWAKLGEAGFEPVRQVAIDADWSALRFRRAEFIKKMTRSTLKPISKAGKEKAGK